MSGLEYQHIGHDPAQGEIALWSIDGQFRVHEERRRFRRADASWLQWSHENAFPDVRWQAVGRVELERSAGSIHISGPALGLSPDRLGRVLAVLDSHYPSVRWFIFGSGFRGENVMAALARRLAEAELNPPLFTAVAPSEQPCRGPTPEVKLRRAAMPRRR